MDRFVRFLAGVVVGCVGLGSAGAGTPDRIAYVIGSNDGSLARVDLATGVVDAPVALVGSQPNRIERSADGTWLAIVNSASEDVAFFDVPSASLNGHVELPAGSNPWTVELTDTNAFVTGLLSDRVYRVDPFGLALVDEAPTGVAPEGLCVADGKLYVANTGFHFDTFTYDPGTVSVLHLGDLSLAATIPVGLNPQECVRAPDGRVHVICTGDFFSTAGRVHVIDPSTDTVTDSLDVAGYPGAAATTLDGTVYLNVTTLTFGTEIWSYDASTLTFGFDGGDPLLPSSDFYGNLRTDIAGRVFVPVFGADLLLVETPALPGTPDAHLVNDGPIDLALVPWFEPVSLTISGVRAQNEAGGIRISWMGSSDGDVRAWIVERKESGGEFALVGARDADLRDLLDADVRAGATYVYRVGARTGSGVQWTAPVHVLRHAGAERLSIRRVLPNPSRNDVTIELAAPSGGRVTLDVVDVQGRRVARTESELAGPGVASLSWDGRDSGGSRVAPGMYFVRVTLGNETVVDRLVRRR